MVVVEYSKKQKCLHYDEIEKSISTNFYKFATGTDEENDWIIIGIFDEMEDAARFCDYYASKIMEERFYGNR